MLPAILSVKMHAFKFVQIWALLAIGAAAIPTPINLPAALTSQLEPRAEGGASAGDANNIQPQSQEKSPFICVWCGKDKGGSSALIGHEIHNHQDDEMVAWTGRDRRLNKYETDKEGYRYFKKYPGVRLPNRTWKGKGKRPE